MIFNFLFVFVRYTSAPCPALPCPFPAAWMGRQAQRSPVRRLCLAWPRRALLSPADATTQQALYVCPQARSLVPRVLAAITRPGTVRILVTASTAPLFYQPIILPTPANHHLVISGGIYKPCENSRWHIHLRSHGIHYFTNR